MPISLVLFDMDDVLAHYDRSARVRCLASLSGRPFDEVAQTIWGSGLEAKADAGLIDDDSYLRETGKLLGCRVSRDDWLLARRESMSPNFEVLALAETVSRTCRIAVLTNNPRLVTDNIAYLCLPIAELFGRNVFASASFSAAKPSTQTFLKCIDSLGAAPSESLFIDDLEANVAGARKAGLTGHVFTGHKVLAEELRQRGLLNR
ncbi:HAD family phosphatase [Paraburkholderia sp. J10-1]|uniref:HAD family hydrolase n=1 Tax=Paraburkholderia sp. J10-1 TaxID=2805430 RepID=UPI002AB7D4A4|nr:HAD family phosphatase [Paraburkholderia sp. J10-1]